MRWPWCPSSANHCGSLGQSTWNKKSSASTWLKETLESSPRFQLFFSAAPNPKNKELKFPSGCQGHHCSSRRHNHQRSRSCLHCQWRRKSSTGQRVVNRLRMELSMSAPGYLLCMVAFVLNELLPLFKYQITNEIDCKDSRWIQVKQGKLLRSSSMRMCTIALETLTPAKIEHLNLWNQKG